jgi:hypothetical protein
LLIEFIQEVELAIGQRIDLVGLSPSTLVPARSEQMMAAI